MTANNNQFEQVTFSDLESFTESQLDEIPFGVVGLTTTGLVDTYNATESKLAGLAKGIIIGTDYFASTAQCFNNFMVAQRLEDETSLDTIIPYMLTLRMRPTPVRLRLIKRDRVSRRYLLIQR